MKITDLKQRVVIVRVDFNVPLEKGEIADDSRIVNAIPTIKSLIQQNCKIILISHLGRPNGYEAKLSLKIVLARLAELTNTKITFSANLEEARAHLARIELGEIILLENIRFYQEEENNNLEFAQQLASLASVYVNDAFSCSHRNHASIAALSSLLPAVAGITLTQEVKMLDSIFDKSQSPVVAIIGGAKISTKLKLIKILAKKIDRVIVAGALANNILWARGIEIGSSRFEPDICETLSEYDNIVLPQDAITAIESEGSETHVCDIRNIPSSEKIFDIGPASIIEIKKILSGCKTVLWNGPLGLFEVKRFSKGTKEVAKMITHLTKRNKIHSIIGGGDSLFAISKLGVDENDFTHLSTGGGAFLEWVSNRGLLNLNKLKI